MTDNQYIRNNRGWEIIVKQGKFYIIVVKFSGIYTNTLDEKGRISIPSVFRGRLERPVLVLTKGLEHCVWILPPDYWEKLSEKILNPQILDMEEASLLHYRFIVPSQDIEYDKIGRVAVPQSLRDYAGLNRECFILGKGDYMEIWDIDAYRAFESASEIAIRTAVKKLGAL